MTVATLTPVLTLTLTADLCLCGRRWGSAVTVATLTPALTLTLTVTVSVRQALGISGDAAAAPPTADGGDQPKVTCTEDVCSRS